MKINISKKILILSILSLIAGAIIFIVCIYEKHTIPQYIFEYYEVDVEQFAEEAKEARLYEDKFEYVYVDKNGNLVFVTNAEQYEKLLDMYIADLEFYSYGYLKKGFYSEYNDSYDEIVMYCKKEEYGDDLTEDGLIHLMIEMSSCQALLVEDVDDIYVYGCIKDSETGEVLYEHTISAASH
ncbi:MAG: hypothetical protein J6A25_01310 [Lachnospiraceae bacterium]|nr:hypothetical protein [Lachnospiraceae bacterium]